MSDPRKPNRREMPLHPLTWAIGIATFIGVCGFTYGLIVLVYH
jgi:hypothetical protein